MTCAHAYPPDLARYVVAHWPTATPLRWSAAVLENALTAAFQASLTVEEGRPTRIRLLLTPVDQLPASGAPSQGVLRLPFDRTRPLNADELRRLAPAVPFETALVGAHVEDGELRIWGIAHSGPAWLAPTWGGRSLVPNWTHDPIVHVTGPGQIAVRCAGKLVGAIEREEVRLQHAALQASHVSPTEVEHSLIGRVGQQMLRRTIQLVRGASHGGMVLTVDSEAGSNLDGLRLKYRIGPGEASQRYRTLLFRILEAVAAATSKASVGWADFASSASAELEALEQAVFEWSRVIANLASIDGAVVLDKRFGLLGFGAEVSAELPTPTRVWRAIDTEARERRPEEIDGVGTRHRAAYRFVNDHPAGLAIVISHDGGVSFVANRQREIVFWEQSIRP